MNRTLKKALKASFSAPAPLEKEKFLGRIQPPPISGFQFVRSQGAYIRKWIWVVSVLIFAVSLLGAGYLRKDMLWCISSFMPLLALAVITESGRSETYGMAELELSTRFSLKSIVLARLGILGVANLILMCLLVPCAFLNSEASVLQTGVYMVCPYLLTVFLGLWAVRKVHGRDGIYLCAGIATGVGIGNLLLYQSVPLVFGEKKFIFWIGALLLLGVGAAKQCRQVIKQTEELAWNL